MPRNALTEMPYHGINVVALWAQASTKLYPSGYWASYEQWRKLGAQVRKGERGSLIIFYKKARRRTRNPRRTRPTRPVSSFGTPTSSTPPRWTVGMCPNRPVVQRSRRTSRSRRLWKPSRLISGTAAIPPAITASTTTSPCQRLSTFGAPRPAPPPRRTMPSFCMSCTHWTGAPHRLDRVKGKRYGDRDYALEELVAELGAAFLVFGVSVGERAKARSCGVHLALAGPSQSR